MEHVVSVARRRVAASMAIGFVAAITVSCSSEADEAAPTDESAVSTIDANSDVIDGGEVFTEADPGADSSTGDLGPVPPPLPTDSVSDSVIDPIDPVPDTGVPGIESDDDFCRAWSEFAGSYQALTYAWAVRGGEDAARLEVVATDVLSSSAQELDASLPAAIEAERQALTVDLPTPLLRRAARAREFLTTAGLDDAAIESIGEMWLTELTDFGLESDDLRVSIDDAALNDAVVAATAALLVELPPIVEDPSLIVDVQITATENYLFENCPDRGILAGNDNVEL